MSDTNLRWLTALVAGALVLVVAMGSVTGSVAVARSLQPVAEQELAAAGLDGVLVGFEGREARLTGGSRTDLREARAVVEGIDGVRRARVDADDRDGADRGGAAVTETSTFELERDDDGVTISGVVPDPDGAADIKAAASLVFEATVTGDLVVDRSVRSAPWVAALPGLLGDVVAVSNLGLVIDESGSMEVRGSIESEAGRAGVLQLVRSAVPGLEVVDAIEIDDRGLGEADAAALNGATLHFPPGGTVLAEGDRRTLDVVADVLRRNVDVSIEACGHAGPDDPARGRQLSADRVAAVKAYLVGVGIDPDRVSTRTFGTTSSVTSPTAAQFRRVDFVVKET